MRSSLLARITSLLLVAFPLVISCGQKQGEAQQPATKTQQQTTTASAPVNLAEAGFVGVEKRLLDTLTVMWEKKGYMTTVDQAAKMLGVAVDDSVRKDLLTKLTANPRISEKLGRYRAPTFILTNQEKMIAQYIVLSEKLKSEFPSVKQVATDLKIAEQDLKARLKFLAGVGMLYDLGQPDATNKLGFSFGVDMSTFMFDMGLRYHVFTVDNGLPFNVGCAKEALFLVSTDFAKHNVRYETHDPWTLEQIVVMFNQGQVESVSPPVAKMVEGGTCGQNNLFASQANAENWIKTQPRLAQQQTPPIYDIAERLTQIATQEKQPGNK